MSGWLSELNLTETSMTGMVDGPGNLKPFVPRLFTQLIMRPKQTITQFQLTIFGL